jgi:hypothetical protein
MQKPNWMWWGWLQCTEVKRDWHIGRVSSLETGKSQSLLCAYDEVNSCVFSTRATVCLLISSKVLKSIGGKANHFITVNVCSGWYKISVEQAAPWRVNRKQGKLLYQTWIFVPSAGTNTQVHKLFWCTKLLQSDVFLAFGMMQSLPTICNWVSLLALTSMIVVAFGCSWSHLFCLWFKGISSSCFWDSDADCPFLYSFVCAFHSPVIWDHSVSWHILSVTCSISTIRMRRPWLLSTFPDNSNWSAWQGGGCNINCKALHEAYRLANFLFPFPPFHVRQQ